VNSIIHAARTQQQKAEFKSSWEEVAPRASIVPLPSSSASSSGGAQPAAAAAGVYASRAVGNYGNAPLPYIPSGPPSAVVEAEYLTGEKKKLSAEQKLVLDLVLAGKSVFFTGAAGTGKSFVLQCLRQILTERGLIDKTYFTGTTGIAAINVGGCTLHSFAGIGIGNGTAEHLVAKVKSSRQAKSRWMNTKILIVDEISMLEADLFDKLALIGSRVRGVDKPFGGIQLVLCGDFFQLPPVKRVKGDVQYAFDAQYWNQAVDFNVVLGQVYRQKDETFLQILNELRQGLVTPQAERLLLNQVAAASTKTQTALQSLGAESKAEERKAGEDQEPKEDDEGAADLQDVLESFEARRKMLPTLLFSRNVDVDAMNEKALAELDGPAHRYVADDAGHSDYINLIRNNCPAPQVLELKLGAQVLLLKNLDLSRGLCNGSRGVVVGFTHVRDLQGLDATSEEVAKRFDVYPKVAFFNESGNAAVVHVFADTWNVEERGVTLASRSQLPLRLAWAITIHKSQGMTISNLEVSFQGIFDYGQAYVALSRYVLLA
jgi:ATP-dependent DNA helicase PIF1